MAGTGLVAGEVVVDALPYFDQGYEAPGVREAVSCGACAAGPPEARCPFPPRPRPVLLPRLRPWWRRKRADTDLPRTT